MGHHLDGVRVHTDAAAQEMARRFDARAFAFGQDIYFAAGQYQPRTQTGRELIAHEVAHTIQPGSRSSAERPVIHRQPASVGQAPHAARGGYQSFYLRGMIPSRSARTEVRVQFYQDPSSPGTATFAVWYQETATIQRVSFAPGGAIHARLIDERPGIARFDLSGDGTADVVLVARPDAAQTGVLFEGTYRENPFFRMHAAPPSPAARRYVQGRGWYFGELATGDGSYYLQPGSCVLPGGCRFVDQHGMRVDPGEAAIQAEFNRGAMRMMIGAMVLGAVGLAFAAVGIAAAGMGAAEGTAALIAALRAAGVRFSAQAIVGIVRTVTGRIVWLETGTAAAGLTHIMARHGSQFARWGLTSASQVGQFLINVVRTQAPVATSAGGAFDFMVRIGGGDRLVRIVIGSNGFIVTAHPL